MSTFSPPPTEAVELVVTPELDIQEYASSIGLNPSNVFYQRFRTGNVTTQRAGWSIQCPHPSALLLSFARVHWKPVVSIDIDTVNGREEDGFDNTTVKASFKPGFPFANAMTSIRCRVNNEDVTLERPCYFMEMLAMMYGGREGVRKLIGDSNTQFWGLNGVYGVEPRGFYNDWAIPDTSLFANEQAFQRNLLENLEDLTAIQLDHIEPLVIPPFNPFARCRDKLPDDCWFKDMSHVIGHVDSLDIDIGFDRLAANVFFPRYIYREDIETPYLAIRDLSADLYLYWYIPPPTMSVPRSLSFQSWQVSAYSKSTAELDRGDSVRIDSDIIQLKEMPTLILLHAEISRSTDEYESVFQTFSDRGIDPPPAVTCDGPNNINEYLKLSALEISIEGRPQTINKYFTLRELFDLTVKNSKAEDFPYAFHEWAGGSSMTDVAGLADPYRQISRCFIALRPEDIGFPYSDGVNVSSTFQVSVTGSRCDDLSGVMSLRGTDPIPTPFTFFIHMFYGKRWLTVSKGIAARGKQCLSRETADRVRSSV